MDTEPIAVGLKFGFLAVLYLFLLWIARSGLRELRRTTAPAPEATGFHQIGPGGRAAASTRGSGSTCSAACRSAARRTPTFESRTASRRGFMLVPTPAAPAITL